MNNNRSFLKKSKDLRPDSSLKYLLHSHLAGFEKARSLSVVHASDLTKSEGFCPRYYALHDVLDAQPSDNWVSTADRVTWDMGYSVQDAIVGYFSDMDRVVGHWDCASCGRRHEFCKKPSQCLNCDCKSLHPAEVRFKSEKSGVSCGIDMLVDLGDGKLTCVEIKTIQKEKFGELLAPLAEHRLRTNLYLRILSESKSFWANEVHHDKAKVFYVCKGGYKADPKLGAWGLPETFSPVKEFDVGRNDSLTDKMQEQAKAVLDYRNGVGGMPCGICPTAFTKRAKSCSVVKACFSGDYPADKGDT